LVLTGCQQLSDGAFALIASGCTLLETLDIGNCQKLGNAALGTMAATAPLHGQSVGSRCGSIDVAAFTCLICPVLLLV
jgi:hypothetical protein